MRKFLTVIFLLATVSLAYGGRPLMTRDDSGEAMQGGAPDPLKTYLIADNFSHTTALYPDNRWFSLNYNGSSVCYVRVMNTQTKASWPQIPVRPSTSFARVAHSNALYLNYSGCVGATGSNSTLEEM